MSQTVVVPDSAVSARTVDVGSLETAFRRKGAGDPLLFLTGQGYSGRWIPLYEQLAARFDVIVPDHPGFGDTELPDFIVDFNDLSVHYAQFLDAVEAGPVHLVGHGFGGWVAAEFAAIYPERVLSMTLIAPSGLRPIAAEPMVDPYRMSRDKWLDSALGSDREQQAPIVGTDPNPVEQMLADYKERMGVARVAWNPRYSLRLEHRLQRVHAPTQVLVPDEDALTAPSIALRYAELLGCTPAATVSGIGAPTQHLMVIQEPDQIALKVGGLAESAAKATN
jgi:pimeloyl-ACP methyl ester carboxylesterase